MGAFSLGGLFDICGDFCDVLQLLGSVACLKGNAGDINKCHFLEIKVWASKMGIRLLVRVIAFLNTICNDSSMKYYTFLTKCCCWCTS